MPEKLRLSRRDFIARSSAAGAGLMLGRLGVIPGMPQDPDERDDFILGRMESVGIPGIAACVLKGNRVVWSKGYGWADIGNKIPMDPNKTIQNIGSVSKTFTATAVMQLWEAGKLDLDDDVNQYLAFSVRHPLYPDTPITIRQLLIHRSSIKDGDAYSQGYRCGDPVVSLKDWIEGYLTPGGEYYHPQQNFHTWKPGEQGKLPARPRNYTNVGFGLLGYLVEVISDRPFSDYCRDFIFKPLRMEDTGWHIREIDRSRHAVPYVRVRNERDLSTVRSYQNMGFLGGKIETDAAGKDYYPLCLYSFPNYPDGLIRTSAGSLARFLAAYMNGGLHEDNRILKSATIRKMFSLQTPGDNQQGLCWMKSRLSGDEWIWGHGGGDPGISTAMFFRPSDRTGVIVFTNGGGIRLGGIRNRLF